MMKPARKNFTTGETLIEAIIAISVILLVIGPASAMMVSSSRAIGQNRNDLLAAALAEEGLEMMRNIRDTNLIRFAQKTEDCWNTIPDVDILLADCAKVSNKIGGNDKVADVRILNLQSDPDTLKWMIDKDGAGVPDVPAPPLADYRLSEDVATNSDPECPNNNPCHTHTGMHFYPSPDVTPPLPRGKLSPFHRQVEIRYVDYDQDGTIDPIMKITSIVKYASSGGTRTIERILFLTNQPAK